MKFYEKKKKIGNYELSRMKWGVGLGVTAFYDDKIYFSFRKT